MGALLAGTLIASIPQVITAQTLARIHDSARINIGFTPEQAPFSSVGADGQPHGYAVDLCQHVVQALKQRAGVPNLTVNYVRTDVAAGLRLLEQGGIDMLCGPIPETLQTRQRASFSLPIYFTGVGAAIRRDAPEALMRALAGHKPHEGPTWRATVNQGLANYTYAVRGGSESERLVRERLETLGVLAKVVTVDSEAAGLDLVAAGKANALFADRAMLATALAKRSDAQDLLVFDRRFTIAPVAIALPRGDEDLRLAVDTSLSEHYRSGEYVRTFVPYFGEPGDTARMLFQAYALR
jgi:polar amino acid transport system substrate-binding protein